MADRRHWTLILLFFFANRFEVPRKHCEFCLKQSYLPLINREDGFSESQPAFLFNSHLVRPLSDLTAPGKVCLRVYLCAHHTPGPETVPEHLKTYTCLHQSSADMALFKRGLTTNDTQSIRGVGDCCGGCYTTAA